MGYFICSWTLIAFATYIYTMKIALLGGSFNPPHQGHVALVKSLLENKKLGGVWVIPCFAHPFEKKLAPFQDRLQMCKLAFESLGSPLHILNTDEEIQNKQGFSVLTLKLLTQKYPEHQFYWVMGSDLTNEKNKWKDFDQIEKLVKLYPIARGGDENSSFPKISSTEIREKISRGESIANLVPSEVEKYIHQTGLYS